MSGQLDQLLRTPTLSRRVTDYETMYDDYIAHAGGRRVIDAVTVPSGISNADYLVEAAGHECILELKQVAKFDDDRAPERYFAEMYRTGDLRTYETLSATQIHVTPESLTRKQWHRFYDKCRPGIPDALVTANGQLRATEALLPHSAKPRLRGVIMLNSGDYHLPTDLMFRLIQRKMTKEWRGGHLRAIDFVTCKSVDLFHPDQHPLHARHIVRPGADDALKDVVRCLFESWVAYVNSELGADTVVGPSVQDDGQGNRVDLAFKGKLRLI